MQKRRHQEEIWLASTSTIASKCKGYRNMEMQREPSNIFCSSSFFSFGGNTFKDIDYIVPYPRRFHRSRTTATTRTTSRDQNNHRNDCPRHRRRRRRRCRTPMNLGKDASTESGLSKLFYKNRMMGGIIHARKTLPDCNDVTPSVTMSSVGSFSTGTSITTHHTCSSLMEFSTVTMIMLDTDIEQGFEITFDDNQIMVHNGKNEHQHDCNEESLGGFTREERPVEHVDIPKVNQENSNENGQYNVSAGQTACLEQDNPHNIHGTEDDTDNKQTGTDENKSCLEGKKQQCLTVTENEIVVQQLGTDEDQCEQGQDNPQSCTVEEIASDHPLPKVTTDHESVSPPSVISSINSQHTDYKSLEISSQASKATVVTSTLHQVDAVGTILNTYHDYMKTIEKVKQKIIKEQTEVATLEAELKHCEKEFQDTLKELTDYLGIMEKQKFAMESKNARIKQALSELKSTRSKLVEFMSST